MSELFIICFSDYQTKCWSFDLSEYAALSKFIRTMTKLVYVIFSLIFKNEDNFYIHTFNVNMAKIIILSHIILEELSRINKCTECELSQFGSSRERALYVIKLRNIENFQVL